MSGGASDSNPILLVLSEDGSRGAVPALAALIKRMCCAILPDIDPSLLRAEPPEETQRQALSGNKWLSAKARDHRAITQLVRTIATHLERSNGFVIFHFDGDYPYARRSQSDRPTKFNDLIRDKVRSRLRDRPYTPPDVETMISKLIVFTPFHDIEAWTYHNTRVLLELCLPHEKAKVEVWNADPTLLEEEVCISKQLTLGKSRNRHLAEQSFPARAAIRAGKSFADAAGTLEANQLFMQALRGMKRPTLRS